MFRWADKMPEETKIPPKPPDPRLGMIKWFSFEHLPEHLQKVSANFSALAVWMLENLPAGAEATTAMRKLLESKDCAVRSAIESGKKA